MAKAKRPETFAEARDKLSTLEWLNIRLIRWSFTTRWVNELLAWSQRNLSVFWVHHCTKHLRHTYGLARIRDIIDNGEPAIFVANHRSFFDMYVANMVIARAGYPQRLLFPVRSGFFYDNPLGFFVNGIMSFFSMYPPIFRDRKRAVLNHVAFGELATDLTRGRSVGIHPEGTRNKDDDPYTFLPAQPGVGRLIHLARVKVVPVFVNGLGNDLKRQITGNFDGTGDPVVVVYGEPIDFGDLLDAPPGPKTFRAIADRCMEVVGELGQEEKQHRAALLAEAEGPEPAT